MITLKNLFILSFFIFPIIISAQENESKWKRSEVFIQNRYLHQIDNVNSFYNTNLDFGLGLNWKYDFGKNSSLKVGGALNYGSYTLNNSNQNGSWDGTLFISFFKKSEVHYFLHESVQQLSLEIPIQLQTKIAEINNQNLYLFGSLGPQVPLFTNHKGSRFGEDLTLTEFPFGSENNLKNTPILSDVFIRTGLEYQIGSKWNLGAGVEYSTFGKSFGSYLKLGFKF